MRTRIIARGFDLKMSGGGSALWNVHDVLKGEHPVKIRGALGPGREDAREVVVLSRAFTWDGDEFCYEVVPRRMLRCNLVCDVGGDAGADGGGEKLADGGWR